MEDADRSGHIDSGGLHAIQPAKRPHSMSAKASSTVSAHFERRGSAAKHLAAHSTMANAIRALAMDAVEQAKSGHPGMRVGQF